jgi:enamine deaminase RidA (YjgF/YER057c/UK114 family)
MTEPSPVQLLRPPDLAGGVPYAYAATTRGRSLCVFTAGACPLDGSGSTVAPGDVVAQAEAVMANLQCALHAAGAGLDDVLKTTVYVASSDRSDLTAAWGVVRRSFGAHDPPSTLLGVSALGYPDQLVVVEAIAALAG